MESATVSNQVSVRKLKLAFCLYKYFPQGGLQLGFLHIAKDCQRRGHEIRVYTLDWVGDIPDGFEVVIVPVYAFTNHIRKERFSAWVDEALRHDPVDGVIGINKMPGLDVNYAADSCYEEKMCIVLWSVIPVSRSERRCGTTHPFGDSFLSGRKNCISRTINSCPIG